MDELLPVDGADVKDLPELLARWANAGGLGELIPGTYYGSDGVVVLHDDDLDGVVDRIAAIGNDGRMTEHVLLSGELARWAGYTAAGPETKEAGESVSREEPGSISPAERLGDWGS